MNYPHRDGQNHIQYVQSYTPQAWTLSLQPCIEEDRKSSYKLVQICVTFHDGFHTKQLHLHRAVHQRIAFFSDLKSHEPLTEELWLPKFLYDAIFSSVYACVQIT